MSIIRKVETVERTVPPARATGKPGVVLDTSGPGATNAVTGLTDALLDSIPLVVISGQVPTFMIGTDGFQEADTVGITRPCTKHNWLVKETDALAETIHKAFHVATSGRAGPELVDNRLVMGPIHDPRREHRDAILRG